MEACHETSRHCRLLRTPIGRAHKDKGVFRDVRSDDLAAAVVRALVERTGIDPAEIEDVVLGNTQQQGEQGFDVARTVALMAGLPIETGGATVNRLCGSSLQAINQAAHSHRGRLRGRADRRRPGAHAPHPDGRRTSTSTPSSSSAQSKAR